MAAKPRAVLALAALGAAFAILPRATAQDAAAPARTIRIYRCTDAAGHVTLQNDTPCPRGSRQEQRQVDVPPPLPAYVPREARMPEVVAAERADEAAAISATLPPAATGAAVADEAPAGGDAVARPAPPPPLQACRTWDEVEYLTEDTAPAERCRPLPVVGVDGAVRADAAACEKVVDQCAAVPAEALCEAWRRRVDEAEFRWKFAGAKQDDARRREYALLAATLARSDCAGRQNP